MYKVIKRKGSDYRECPFTIEYLNEILNTYKGELNDSTSLLRHLLTNIGTKSSKHKFLVEVHQIEVKETMNADLRIVSKIGTLWNDEKDGYVNLEIGKVEPNDDETTQQVAGNSPEKKGEHAESTNEANVDKDQNTEKDLSQIDTVLKDEKEMLVLPEGCDTSKTLVIIGWIYTP